MHEKQGRQIDPIILATDRLIEYFRATNIELGRDIAKEFMAGLFTDSDEFAMRLAHPNMENIKQQAKALVTLMRTSGIAVKHCTALNALARLYGAKNLHVLQALGKDDSAAAGFGSDLY